MRRGHRKNEQESAVDTGVNEHFERIFSKRSSINRGYARGLMRNTDATEIAKFSAMADEWWNPDGPMKPLHALNPLRLAYLHQHAVLTEKNVLDLGCGAGILTESLAKAGAIATGIDMSESVITIAKKHATQSQLTIDYQCIDAETLSKNHGNYFDVITCMEMLEHVPDPLSIIQAAEKMLKPSGKLFFSTINRNIKSFFSAIIGAEYILNLLPKGTHHYQKFIRPSELTAWAEKNNLTLCDIQGIAYHPLKNTFSFSTSVDVNYLICFQK